MNVWIDLGHIPQYNFYKKLIIRLASEGNSIYITVLKRGKMPLIIQRELKDIPNISIEIIGTHRSNKVSAIIEANIIRLLKLLFWAKGKNIDVALSNSFVTGIVSCFYKIRSYAFGDDIRKLDYLLKSKFNKESYYCIYDFKKLDKPNVHILKSLKEWSYLAPSVFHPDISVLSEYGLEPKSYIFLREVSVGTVNYSGQSAGAILDVKDVIPNNLKVLFSLEDKSKRNLYPQNWILLQEPLKDVHSLIYYSVGLVSSGDSMAREASLLGVPAYYLGIRHNMPANLAAAEVADFSNENNMPFVEWIDKISCSADELNATQILIRQSIESKFIDINDFMYKLVTQETK